MPVVGKVSRLTARNLYLIIQNRKSWDYLCNIKDEQKAIDEIFCWQFKRKAYVRKQYNKIYNVQQRIRS